MCYRSNVFQKNVFVKFYNKTSLSRLAEGREAQISSSVLL